MSQDGDCRIIQTNTHYGKHFEGECKHCGWRTMSYSTARSVRAMIRIHIREAHTK